MATAAEAVPVAPVAGKDGLVDLDTLADSIGRLEIYLVNAEVFERTQQTRNGVLVIRSQKMLLVGGTDKYPQKFTYELPRDSEPLPVGVYAFTAATFAVDQYESLSIARSYPLVRVGELPPGVERLFNVTGQALGASVAGRNGSAA